MQALNAVASNSAAIVTGGVTLQHVVAYEVGQTIQFNSPLLLAENASDVVLQIENAKGLGIDLNRIECWSWRINANGVVIWGCFDWNTEWQDDLHT